jgi:excisionase family DNA binding protein
MPVQSTEPLAEPKTSRTQLNPITVTVAEARQITRLGNTKIYELIAEGKLRSVAVGRRRLIFVSSIHALLDGAVA